MIHCAWAGVLGKDRDSNEQDNNLRIAEMTVKLAQTHKVRRVIAFGSQAEYGSPNIRVREDYPTDPATLYGKTKVKCHKIFQEAIHGSNFDFCWLRLFDPYGPGDNTAWFIPYVIRCALNDESPRLTECTQKWDYIYIDDLCRCIRLLSSARLPKESTYNISSDNPVLLRDVVDLIYDYIMPLKRRPNYGAVPFRPDQVFHLQGNNEKLKAVTGWQPSTSIEAGIKKTIDYFKLHGFK